MRRDACASLILLAVLGHVGCATLAPSPALSPTPIVETDVPYAMRAEGPLLGDVYLPGARAARTRSPAVLLVHGGSWQRGDKDQMASIAERLARRGYVAVSVNYRLAPEHPFPAQIHDLKEAVRWIRRESERLGVDPERVGAFGYSAGGHLVALLATTDPADGLEGPRAEGDPSTRIQAAVLGAAPTDLRRFPPSGTFERLLGGSLAERPEAYAQASPITYVSPDDAPTFLYHGAEDWIVDIEQSRAMTAALADAGVPHELVLAPYGHFWTFLFDDDEVARAGAFLDRWLRGAEPHVVAHDGPRARQASPLHSAPEDPRP